MKAVWKFSLVSVVARQSFDMPVGAELLSLQIQGGVPQLWALCDAEASREQQTFTTYGTGHPIPDNPGAYVGTYQLHGGALVYHVFKVG